MAKFWTACADPRLLAAGVFAVVPMLSAGALNAVSIDVVDGRMCSRDSTLEGADPLVLRGEPLDALGALLPEPLRASVARWCAVRRRLMTPGLVVELEEGDIIKVRVYLASQAGCGDFDEEHFGEELYAGVL